MRRPGQDREQRGYARTTRIRDSTPGPSPIPSEAAIGEPPRSGDRRLTMTTGPVESLVVGFPDGTVSDDLAPELAKLVYNEVIRVLDLVVLTKDTSGDIAVAE